MKNIVRFTKMHGAGNDYIYVNTLLYNIPDPAAAAVAWSDRHKGIGADGLVLIGAPQSAENDFSMRIFNADGSEAMMCGNAARCIGKYVFQKRMKRKRVLRLETLSGVKMLRLRVDSVGRLDKVTVDMGAPSMECPEQFLPEKAEELEAIAADGMFVSMGNPHYVVFVDDAEAVDVERLGSIIENHPAFPCRTNVEFVSTTFDGRLRTRVWERGSGVTMACGTGACAVLVAAALKGRTSRRATVSMDGGDLTVEWFHDDSHVWLTGPAEIVYEGEVKLPESKL